MAKTIKFFWVFVIVFCSSAAVAVEWTVEPSISVAETYTDNLELDPDGLKADEFITEVMPAIQIGALGKRFQADFEYRLQTLIYANREDLDETLNYSRTSGAAKLVGDSLLLNFSGSLNQQIVNPGGRIGISAVTPGNRSEVGSFTVNPVWQQKFGSNGIFVIGYQYGLVEYGEDQVNNIRLTDNESSGFNATISSAPPRSSFSWRLTARDSSTEYDTNATADFRRVGGEFAWRFGKNSIFVGGGDEDNEFKQLAGRSKIDGSFWNVGLRGQLDRLTTFSISAGEEHFGDSYQFSLLRTAGKLTTDISYLEETTTIGQQQLGYEPLFQFLSDITGSELPTAGAEVYVRKRLSVVGALELARSRLRLNAYNEDRDYLTTALGESDGVSGVALSWTWTALQRTRFSVDVGWQSFELRDSDNTPEDVRLQLRLNREYKKGLSFNVRAWRNGRAGTVPTNEYDSSAASIGIVKRF